MSVINDTYQFVFIHVPRTGGRSITKALREIPGTLIRDIDPSHETAAECKARLPHTADYTYFAVQRNEGQRRTSGDQYLSRRFGSGDVGSWRAQMHQTKPFAHFVDQDTVLLSFATLETSFVALMGTLGVTVDRLPFIAGADET